MDKILKNPKISLILGIALVFVIIIFRSSDHSESLDRNTKSLNVTQHQKTFDVASGDTNNEVLKSIVARQQAEDTANKQLIDENKKLELQNESLQKKDMDSMKQYVNQQITSQASQLALQKSQSNSVTKNANSKLDNSSNKLEYPISGALSNVSQTQESTNSADSVKSGQVISSIPDLSSEASQKASLVAQTKMQGEIQGIKSNSLEQSGVSPLPSDSTSGENFTQSNKIPYYTIPDGATAPNTVLLSPLVGEVPVNGQLLSPAFPFKAIISYKDTKDMFAANGIPLPQGISGTILQGYSVGDMSLGCARAYVMKILFVFHDGHYVVFPKDKDSNGGKNATEVYPSNSIGYLSDPYNNACIVGKYITDAPKVIASLAAFGGVAAAGGAIAQAQTQTVSNFSTGTAGTLVSGNLGKYALGNGIGDGSKAALAWYQARVNNIFDVVFVPSTDGSMPRRLIFNITKTIPIDLQQSGRTLDHANQNDFKATDHSFE